LAASSYIKHFGILLRSCAREIMKSIYICKS